MVGVEGNTTTIRDVLLGTFPALEMLDERDIDAIIEGQSAKIAVSRGGAKLNLHDLLDFVRTWAPIAANLVTIAKVAYDAWGSSREKPRPTVEEVLRDYEAAHGPIPPDRLRDMTRLASVTVAKA